VVEQIRNEFLAFSSLLLYVSVLFEMRSRGKTGRLGRNISSFSIRERVIYLNSIPDGGFSVLPE
jgi:hypothetical protein